jgi:hypothetical protein
MRAARRPHGHQRLLFDEILAHEPHVLHMTLEHRLPLGHGALNLQPAAVADCVERLAHRCEIDPSLSEQEPVLLRVKLAMRSRPAAAAPLFKM